MTARRRRWFIAVAVLLPFALLVIAEAVLRTTGAGRPRILQFVNPEGAYVDGEHALIVRDPELFWRLRPGGLSAATGERIGASGFRTEFAVAKASGARRVVCLGDSNTFGLGVHEADSWPAVLGRTLNSVPAAAGPWEVLNVGVPGYTSWQERRLMETELAPLTPDVVVIETGAFNEWVPAPERTDRDQMRGDWMRLRIVDAVFARRPVHNDGDAVRRLVANLKTASYTGLRRVPLAEFEDDLRAQIAWTAARGARVVFLVHPLPAGTSANNPIALEYAATVRRVAASAGVDVVDGWKIFRESGVAEGALFSDFCHARERGHQLLADAVAAVVSR